MLDEYSLPKSHMPDADVTKLPALKDLNGSLTDRVYTAVKSAVLTLEFPPGASVRKTALCEHLGLSRSPVSEALSRLSVEGLVDIVPQSGTRVSRLSMAAIREDTFLREALEVAAAAHAATHRSDEVLARMTRNLEMQKMLIASGDREEFIQTDKTFHDMIMVTTGVTRLPGAVRALSPHIERARFLMAPEPGRLSETVEEHIVILDAIRDADAEAARTAMSLHVRALLKRLAPLEAERPDLFKPEGKR